MKYLLTFLLAIISMDATCQNNSTDTLIFKTGRIVFDKLLNRGIRPEYLNDITHNVYFNVNMTINSEGKIKRIDLFSVDDSAFAKILYDVLMQTDGGWVNTSKEDQIFNILFEVRYAVNAIDKEAPIKFYSDIYEEGKLKKVTRYGKYPIIVYPTQH